MDVSSSASDKKAGNLRYKVKEYKQAKEKLSAEISLLKKELNFANAENKRLLLVGRNENSKKSTSSVYLNDQIDKLDQEKNKLTGKLKERDATISSLVKASMSQEQQVLNLRKDLEDLGQEITHSPKRATSSKSSAPSRAEFHRLQQESEIFAGQIIEQDEELEELRQNMKDKQAEQNKTEKEMSTLKSKLRRLENSTDLTDMKDELHELEKSNLSLREELRDVKRKLRQSHSQADRAADLENELKEASAALSALKKAKSKMHMDEMKESEMKDKLEQITQDKLRLEESLRRNEENISSSKKREHELEKKLENVTYTKEVSDAKMKKNFESLKKSKQNEEKLQSKLGDALDGEEFLKQTVEKLKEEFESMKESNESEKLSNTE